MKNKENIMKKSVIVLSLVSVGIFFGILMNTAVSGDNVYEQLKKFQYVYNVAFRNYVEEVDPNKLNEAAIEGMLEDLDVHSVYIDKDEMKKVKESFSGEFEGIGIEFDMIEDTITVITPLAGGPSEELGILAGDKIVKIDGEDAVGMPRSEVPKKLKGEKGTKVTVDIKREGSDELINFEIIRDKIPIETVDASYMIEDSDIGYISINRFAQNTHSETMEAVADLKKKGMGKLILDLRGNPGGYLTQAFYMADEFLKKGDTIVYTEGRREEFSELYKSTEQGSLEEIPLIVMINEGSASASEIVSGAVQDLDRGLIVGETSYGKGLVQRQYDLGDGSAFRLTISYYYTPSGRSIQRPYKDKEAYRSLAGRLELEEGANLQHALEKIQNKKDDKEEIDQDSIPTFRTRAGRIVLGGGGITPDYIIKSDTSKLTETVASMRMKRVFYDFVYDYLRSPEGTDTKEKYQNDFPSFSKNFEVDKEMLDRIVEIAKNKEIEIVEEDFQKDIDYVKLYTKATIAKIVWDRNRQLQVMANVDRQLKKAVTLFDEAKKISSLN